MLVGFDEAALPVSSTCSPSGSLGDDLGLL